MHKRVFALALLLATGLALTACSSSARVSDQLSGEWFNEQTGARLAFVSAKDVEIGDDRTMASYRVPEDNVIELVGTPMGDVRTGIRQLDSDNLVLSGGWVSGEGVYVRDYAQTLPAKLAARTKEIIDGYRAALDRFPSAKLSSGIVDIDGAPIDISDEDYVYDWAAMESWKRLPGWRSAEATLPVPLGAVDDPVPNAIAVGVFAPPNAPGVTRYSAIGGSDRLPLVYASQWTGFPEGQFFADEKQAVPNKYLGGISLISGKTWLSLGGGYAIPVAAKLTGRTVVRSSQVVWVAVLQ